MNYDTVKKYVKDNDKVLINETYRRRGFVTTEMSMHVWGLIYAIR